MNTFARDNPDTLCPEDTNTIHQAHHLMELVRQYRETRDQHSAEQPNSLVLDADVERQVSSTLPVLAQIVAQLNDAQAECQRHWERSAVRVATAIAQRIIRRELSRQPEITLDLVGEALRLAAGATDISLHLNPADYEQLGSQVERLADTLCKLAPSGVVANPEISPGGCRVETRFGEIDLQIESQISRIEQELLND